MNKRPGRIVTALAFVLTGCAGSGAGTGTGVPEPEFVRIDGGTFEMGDAFERSNDDALPVHRIEVSTFYLSKYETTFEQYDAFARRTWRALPEPDVGERGKRAVVDVSWDEAAAYCVSIGARLPNECEWEYAAAGGALKQKYAGTNDDLDIDPYVSHRENSEGRSLEVGLKQPNRFGLYDMS